MQQMTQFTNHEDTEVKNSLDTTVKSESLSDRDAGFYSGEDTDFDVQYHSPIETSRDSTDTCEESIDSRQNKRKCIEPKKFHDGEPHAKQVKLLESTQIKSEPCDEYDDKTLNVSDRATSPLVIKNKIQRSTTAAVKTESWQCNTGAETSSHGPFRPWNIVQREMVVLPEIPSGYSPPLASPYQVEPLALVVEKRRDNDGCGSDDNNNRYKCQSVTPPLAGFCSREVETADKQIQDLRIGRCPQEVVRINKLSVLDDARQFEPPINSDHNRYPSSSSTTSSVEGKHKSSHSSNSGHLHQRNYKNMTRERRIEANARERTRVHTISAAFETLRKCVPAYANNQKLSKLSVLRIACSYIMTLSRIAGYDYSVDQSAPSVAKCVESVSNTIQMEGKTRKK